MLFFCCKPLALRLGPTATIALAILCGSSASSALAQKVTNAAQVTVKPTVSRDDKGFSLCGVRVALSVGEGKANKTYDFLVTAHADNATAMIKAGSYSHLKTGVAEIEPAPVGFSILEMPTMIVATATKIVPADIPGFSVGESGLLSTMIVMHALADGKPMKFSIRLPKQKVDTAVSFQKSMTKPDLAAYDACAEGLHDRITRNQR